jgi:hypothetical protein
MTDAEHDAILAAPLPTDPAEDIQRLLAYPTARDAERAAQVEAARQADTHFVAMLNVALGEKRALLAIRALEGDLGKFTYNGPIDHPGLLKRMLWAGFCFEGEAKNASQWSFDLYHPLMPGGRVGHIGYLAGANASKALRATTSSSDGRLPPAGWDRMSWSERRDWSDDCVREGWTRKFFALGYRVPLTKLTKP